ncbi:MAG: hypothetical protein KDD22_06350 [Bdellovibrionales bacterium]|nr:hypothetical protein [Bdellovibrionales bacterium]
MSKARTVRFSETLDAMVDEYVEKNGIKFNQLVNLAVKKFISESHTIKLEPVEAKDGVWEKQLQEAMKNNRRVLDELS